MKFYPRYYNLLNKNYMIFNRTIKKFLVKHPKYAGKLINDPHPYVRQEVAKHPEHAGKLVNDSNMHVSDQAKETLGIS